MVLKDSQKETNHFGGSPKKKTHPFSDNTLSSRAKVGVKSTTMNYLPLPLYNFYAACVVLGLFPPPRLIHFEQRRVGPKVPFPFFATIVLSKNQIRFPWVSGVF